MLKAHLEQGFAHARWADDKLLKIVQGPGVPDKALRLMAHYFSTFHVWAERMTSNAVQVPIWPEPESFPFQEKMEGAYERMADVLAQFGPDYEQTFAYTDSKGRAFTNTVGDTLQHLLLHGHYHRGQVNQLLREAGLMPALIDYIVYVRTKSEL